MPGDERGQGGGEGNAEDWRSRAESKKKTYHSRPGTLLRSLWQMPPRRGTGCLDVAGSDLRGGSK